MTSPAQDPASAAFEETADTLDQAAVEARTAARRVRRLRRERTQGGRWRDVLGGGVAQDLLAEIGGAVGRQSSAAGRLRRVQEAAGSSSPADEISKLADLKASGALSEQEFEAEKAKILA
jgi:hypothetical protein